MSAPRPAKYRDYVSRCRAISGCGMEALDSLLKGEDFALHAEHMRAMESERVMQSEN